MQPLRVLLILLAAVFAAFLALWGVIASGVLEVPLATLEQRYRLPASQFIDVDGVRVHVVDEGEGPPIMLLHASFMELRSWDAVAAQLSRDRRVIRLDLLMAGLTGPDPQQRYSIEQNVGIVARIADQLALAHFDLLGTSSGGMVAFRYAAQHPERVSRLVLVNSAGLPRTAATDPNRPRGTALQRWIQQHHRSRAFWRESLAKQFTSGVTPDAALVERVHDMNRRQGLREEGRLFMRNFRTGDPEAILARVRAPTLVLWGEGNITLSHLEADVFARWLVSAPVQVQKLPRVGHYPYLEDPAGFTTAVGKFLQSTPASEAITDGLPASDGLRFVRAPDGTPLCVRTAGPESAPPILLLHGFAQSQAVFKRQFESTLARDFRLVAFDLRGHGCSGKPWSPNAYVDPAIQAADVKAVIEATGLARPLLVGWSFGGYVISDYLRTYGAQGLSGVVLAGSHGGLIGASDGPALEREQQQRELARTALPGIEEGIAVGHQFVRLMSAKPLPVDLAEIMFVANQMFPTYVRRAMADIRLDNADLLQRYALPTRFVVGAHDRSLQAGALEALAASMPQASVVVFGNSGHSPFAEESARFNEELRQAATPR